MLVNMSKYLFVRCANNDGKARDYYIEKKGVRI